MKRTRSAKSGQFVGKEDAAANPETTIVETVMPSRETMVARAARAMYHETHPGSAWTDASPEITMYWLRLAVVAVDNLDLEKAEDDED